MVEPQLGEASSLAGHAFGAADGMTLVSLMTMHFFVTRGLSDDPSTFAGFQTIGLCLALQAAEDGTDSAFVVPLN
ncbi:hypothetical protein [Sphingomonas sp. SUN039]|uniref:hypothetical protein n=1 Tax=Sphingomonas sp. SUN039 TaxID=2937787 RepID=UPI0021644BB5|nr:hypothetical protein [Sphingomonas sp. SUN039]UVO53708.1 hypothetical protein M0209_06085 [Sphingomonas sp. SUN039]